MSISSHNTSPSSTSNASRANRFRPTTSSPKNASSPPNANDSGSSVGNVISDSVSISKDAMVVDKEPKASSSLLSGLKSAFGDDRVSEDLPHFSANQYGETDLSSSRQSTPEPLTLFPREEFGNTVFSGAPEPLTMYPRQDFFQAAKPISYQPIAME